MAVSQPKSNIAKVLIVIILIIGMLGVCVFLISRLSFSRSQPLSPGTFRSAVEPRVITKPDGTRTTYYVLNTYNTSPNDYFACKISLTSKGTIREYQGFVKTYTETDCRRINEPRSHYDCRIKNWINRLQNYEKSQIIERITAGSAYEIALSRFNTYDQDRVAQTVSSSSFTSRQQLSDIFDVKISCQNSSGSQVEHIQVFDN